MTRSPPRLVARRRFGCQTESEPGAPGVSSIPEQLPGHEPASARMGYEDERTLQCRHRCLDEPSVRRDSAGRAVIRGAQYAAGWAGLVLRLHSSAIAAIGRPLGWTKLAEWKTGENTRSTIEVAGELGEPSRAGWFFGEISYPPRHFSVGWGRGKKQSGRKKRSANQLVNVQVNNCD